MKKIILVCTMATLLLASCDSGGSYSNSSSNVSTSTTRKCGQCNGSGMVYCQGCSGRGYIDIMQYHPYYGVYYIPQQCMGCGGTGMMMCRYCGGMGHVNSNNYISFGSRNKEHVEVSVPGCSGTNVCSCKTYKGYRISGTNSYVGNCENYCGGKPCNHPPQNHGL